MVFRTASVLARSISNERARTLAARKTVTAISSFDPARRTEPLSR